MTQVIRAAGALTGKFNGLFKLNFNVLLILFVVAQHSFPIKFFGVGLVALLNLDAIRRFQPKKIPLFYTLIPALEVLKFVFMNPSYGMPHLLQFLLGMAYWVAALLVCWVLYDTVNKGQHIKRSVDLFAIINFAFCICQLIRIMLIEHTINPYNTGHNHPYGISSGDLINGAFHGIHLTNAFVSLMLVVYYIHENKLPFVVLCLTTLLLTGSNYATIIFFIAAGLYFFLNKAIRPKLVIAGCGVIAFLFYWLVTPLNAEYMLEKILHTTATLPNAKRDMEREDLERQSEFTEFELADTLMPYVSGHGKKIKVRNGKNDSLFNFVKQPGKTRSYYQTRAFLSSSVPHLLFGGGLGSFSSRLAFNSSGIMEGSSLNKYLPRYETAAFRDNHKALYAYLKTQHIMFHSESNRPFSVYNQLLGEYGLVGFLLFVLCYLWYFVKRVRRNSYALPLLAALLFIFNIDYFIESLSVLLVFELLLFIDIKQKAAPHEQL